MGPVLTAADVGAGLCARPGNRTVDAGGDGSILDVSILAFIANILLLISRNDLDLLLFREYRPSRPGFEG